MRIGVFGGSFDPPHAGHLAVAQAAADSFSLDRVLLTPVGRQPLKPGLIAASYDDRCAMVDLLCAADARLQLSRKDAPRVDGSPNFSVDLLARFHADLPPGALLFNLVGVDSFRGLPQWRDPGQLLEACDWIVVSRPGLDIQESVAETLALLGASVRASHIHSLDSVHEQVSATEIRTRLAAQLSCEGLVPEPVLRYIATHHLYGSKGGPSCDVPS